MKKSDFLVQLHKIMDKRLKLTFYEVQETIYEAKKLGMLPPPIVEAKYVMDDCSSDYIDYCKWEPEDV